MRVLMTADQPVVRRSVADVARRAGIDVVECDGYAAQPGMPPDLVVVALQAPEDEAAAARELQASAPGVPVLLLRSVRSAAASDAADALLGAEAVALLALRRDATRSRRHGDLELQPARSRALWNGVDLGCTPCEFRILDRLAARRGDVVAVAELRRAVSPQGEPAASNVVAQLVSRLRTKLRLHGGGDAIETRRGLGYAFVAG